MLSWLKNLFGSASVPTEPTLKADYENAVKEEKVEQAPKAAPKKKRAPAKKKAPAKKAAPAKRGRPKKTAD